MVPNPGGKHFQSKGQYSPPPEENDRLPIGYLKNGIVDSEGNYDISYITTQAEKIARMLSGGKEATATSKVRSYFDTVVLVSRQLATKAITDNQARLRIAQLKPRVASRVHKDTASRLFGDFISKNVDYILSHPDKTMENIKAFKEHFEAVIGFMG